MKRISNYKSFTSKGTRDKKRERLIVKSFYLLVCTDYLYNLETRNRMEKILSYCGEYQIIGVVGINRGGGWKMFLKLIMGV